MLTVIRQPLGYWYENETPAALKEAYQSQTDVSIRTRVYLLWLIRSGWQIKASADAVGAHYRHAQRREEWVSPGFMSECQELRLVDEVGSGQFRAVGEIADWIESEHGVRFKENSKYSTI